MAKTQSTYPTTIDSTLQVDRVALDTITSESYDILEDGLFELETKVGVDSSAVATTIDYKLKNAASIDPGHLHTSTSASGGTGNLVQRVTTQTGTAASGTTVIPYDNTIPQIDEGNEYMTVVITPKSATNILVIDVTVYCANSAAAGARIVAALFKDATANALAVGWYASTGAHATECIHFRHTMTAGTVSPITFRVRAGGNSAGTTTFNGENATAFYGGVIASSITVLEIVA